jgi:hypothetical protein
MSQSHGAKPRIVFSVYQAAMPNSFNVGSHEIARDVLKFNNAQYVECLGVYDGSQEQSFVLNAEHESLVQNLCQVYEQECYMYLEPHMHGLYKAYFVWLNDTTVKEFQGYLRSVPKEVALAADGYSYRADLDTYWIIDCNGDTCIAA